MSFGLFFHHQMRTLPPAAETLFQPGSENCCEVHGSYSSPRSAAAAPGAESLLNQEPRAAGGRVKGTRIRRARLESARQRAAMSRRTRSSGAPPASPAYFDGRRSSPKTANTR